MELLAPAGDMAALFAAVQNGADAVYLGAQKFSARKNAGNFEDAELKRAVDYCHLRGVKVYLAINTLIKDDELDEAFSLCVKASQYGVDALIVQDLGLASLINKSNLKIRLHASTQMTAKDEYALKFLKQRGFSRVVLARECSKERLLKLSGCAKEIGIEIEVFCHGAICVSYSGQCLLSSFLGGRSANRGACAQPCRLPYSVNNKSGYYLSPKDLSLLDEISNLKQMGVTSLKIEGRMKGAAYVAAVTSVYKKYIENQMPPKSEDIALLENVFSRGGSFTKGLYASLRGEKMMQIQKGNDDIYKNQDKELIKSLELTASEKSELRKVSTFGKLYTQDNSLVYELSDGFNVVVCKACFEAAKNDSAALTEEYAYRQLSKLGNTPFILCKLSFCVDKPVFVPASVLNAMRREAVEKLTQKRIMVLAQDIIQKPEPVEKKVSDEPFFIAVSVETEKQAEALRQIGVKHIYARYPLCDKIDAEYAILSPAEPHPANLSSKRVLAGCIGAFEYAKQHGLLASLDFTMNIFNKRSATSLLCDFVTVSPELSFKEVKKLSQFAPCQMIAYGHMPLMRTGNCIISTAGACEKKDCKICEKQMYLTDRKGERLRVLSNGEVNIVYNAHPIFLADKMDEIKKSGLASIRLMFTNETPEECVEIYKMYTGQSDVLMPKQFTRGHFLRGLENM